MAFSYLPLHFYTYSHEGLNITHAICIGGFLGPIIYMFIVPMVANAILATLTELAVAILLILTRREILKMRKGSITD